MALIEVQFGKDRYHQIGDMITWLMKNVGQGGYIDEPGAVWFIQQAFGNSFFKFKREEDAVIFSLRWA